MHTLKVVLRHPGRTVFAAAFHPESKIIATGCGDGVVRLWESETGKLDSRTLRMPGKIMSLTWQPDGKKLAICSVDGLCRLWDPGEEKPSVSFRWAPPLGVMNYWWRPLIAFNPNGTKVLLGSPGRTVQVYNTQTGEPTGLVLNQGNATWAEAVAWSRDGTMLLTGNSSGRAQAWDAETGFKVGPGIIVKGVITSVDFSPDGSTFLPGEGWYDSKIQVWETTTGKPVGPAMDHFAAVHSAAFSPDGTRIFSGNSGNEAVLWDVMTGQFVGRQFGMGIRRTWRPSGRMGRQL